MSFVRFDTARLLVADDDPILREFATVHLATPDVEVEVAEDGLIALDRLLQGGIDIALIDLEMPNMDGFELIERVRANHDLKYLPIVVATGREDMAAVDRAYALGATSFVVKPLNWRVLSHQLAYVLRNARDEAVLRRQLYALQSMNAASAELLNLCSTNLIKPANAIFERAGTLYSSHEPGVRHAATEIRDHASGLRTLQDNLSQAARLLAEG
jgi:DNA-binding response OmpR family regulator